MPLKTLFKHYSGPGSVVMRAMDFLEMHGHEITANCDSMLAYNFCQRKTFIWVVMNVFPKRERQQSTLLVPISCHPAGSPGLNPIESL